MNSSASWLARDEWTPLRPRLLVVPDWWALFQECVHTLNHVFGPGQFTKVEFLRAIQRFLKVTTGTFAQGALGQGKDGGTFVEESFDVIIDGFSQSCPGDDAIDDAESFSLSSADRFSQQHHLRRL